MEYVPHIIAVLALLVAGFTFFKTSAVLERVRFLEKKNRELEAGLKGLERNNRQPNQNQGRDNNRSVKGNQQAGQPQPQQQPQRGGQPQEPRQKQPQPQGRGQQPQEPRANQGQPQEPRQKQPQQPQQPQRQPQEPKQKQEGQPLQQRPPREQREPRQPQEPRQKQPQQPLAQPQGGGANQPPRAPQQQPQQPRRNENRRREPLAGDPEQAPVIPPVANTTLGTELVGDNLLSELTQPEVTQQVTQPEAPVSRTRYAIIPEDGVVKSHQLQQRPDSDSYLEIDTPAEGSITTNYRFNVSGNQAFVISQGMDRLENAFSFEKPSNRMVNRIVLQGDGVLTRTSAGWKIQEKAKIDFR